MPCGRFTDADRRHMARALSLAERGLGRVEPNPMVGAVIVRDGRTVGEGWHARFGAAHAEVVALRAAREDARGATLYVSLEPCCHHGKTPPCTEAILAAGVARVVAAVEDPFPEVRGRGIARLREADVAADVGLMETEARRLNAPYFKRHAVGRPYVIAKWAQTLDGRLATAEGDSRWISSPESRRWVHTLRSRMDAILVGSGTALADDPLLTARPETGSTDFGRRPVRVVLDGRLRLPLESQLVTTAREVPLVVATRAPTPKDRAARLRERGAIVLELPQTEGGECRLGDLLKELADWEVTNLLVEGGPAVLSSFLAEGHIDRLTVFIAPKIVGGEPRFVAPGPVGARAMAEAPALLHPSVTRIGPDALIEGLLHDYGPPAANGSEADPAD